jgi:hypothetical protein
MAAPTAFLLALGEFAFYVRFQIIGLVTLQVFELGDLVGDLSLEA